MSQIIEQHATSASHRVTRIAGSAAGHGGAVIRRRLDEEVWIGDDICVRIVKTGSQVGLQIAAPKSMRITRGELKGAKP